MQIIFYIQSLQYNKVSVRFVHKALYFAVFKSYGIFDSDSELARKVYPRLVRKYHTVFKPRFATRGKAGKFVDIQSDSVP